MARGIVPNGDSISHSSTPNATASCGSQIQRPMPTRVVQPSIEETRAAAQVLFTQFCREHLPPGVELEVDPTELEREEEIPDEISQSLRNTAHLEGYASETLSVFGSNLRKIADQFEHSRERRNVRIEASKVDLSHIGYHSFRKMLSELFEGGKITRERIMVLFFFCSDVAARALDMEAGGQLSVTQLFTWSLAFILDVICSWVQRQGGWAVVLGDFIPRFFTHVFAAIGVITCAVIIKQKYWP